MRFLFVYLFLFSYSQVHGQEKNLHNPGWEKFYSLDTNRHFKSAPLASLADTLRRLEKSAEQSGDLEYLYSLRLFNILKKFREHIISPDTCEYRLLKLASEVEDKNLMRVEADVRQSLGDFYDEYAHQESAAIEQYLLAFAIYQSFNSTDYPDKEQFSYRVGLMFYKYQDYENSLKYLKEAVNIKRSSAFVFFGPIYNTIGLAFRQLKEYDSAIAYFNILLDSATRQDIKVWIGIAQGNIGITYYLQKDYQTAVPMLEQDIKYSIENSNVKNAVNSMVVLAGIYTEQGKYSDAEDLLVKALNLARKKSFWSEYTLSEKIYAHLYKVYAFEKKYTLAHLYADSALVAKDSAVSRYNALALSKAYERQNFIKKKLAQEKQEANAKISMIEADKERINQQQLLYRFIISFLLVLLIVPFVVNRYRNSIRSLSTNTGDEPEIVVQKLSIVFISIATCVASLVWAWLFYYYYGICLPTLGPIIYFICVAPSLLYYFVTKRPDFLVNVQLLCIFFIPVLIQFSGGGFKSGVVLNWAFLAPIGALMYKGLKPAAYFMGLLITAVLCTIVFDGYFSQFYRPITDSARAMFYGVNIVGPSVVIYISMQFFVKSIVRNGELLRDNNVRLSEILDELKHEKKKSDDLLLNILPEEVAEELKAKGTTVAKHFENVTVIFTDFADFTSAGERMTPQELVDELHACFKAFDEIIGKYGIEKIKTVGDAYLAVTGLPVADKVHAEKMVMAALEINHFMVNRLAKIGDKTFGIRVGVHSGSVVAGIVGVKKFAYDIWGDTVNTAARIEQNCESGKVNISQTTYDLVGEKFNCTYRGEIEAKGKGSLKMYYVTNK